MAPKDAVGHLCGELVWLVKVPPSLITLSAANRRFDPLLFVYVGTSVDPQQAIVCTEITLRGKACNLQNPVSICTLTRVTHIPCALKTLDKVLISCKMMCAPLSSELPQFNVPRN